MVGMLLVFATAFLLVWGLVPEDLEREEIYGYRLNKRQRLLEEDDIYRVTLPVIQIFAHHIRNIPDGTLTYLDKIREDLRDKLPRSGHMGAYTPNEFLGLCCTMALGAFIFFLFLTTWMTGAPRLPVALIMGSAATYMPFLKLNSDISQRLIEIDQRLPHTMDLLVLSMNAGLDFMTALDRVVERGKEQNPDDPMIQELGVVLQELKVGTPRTDALKNLCERVQSDYLDSMVGSIIQAEKRGTPLSEVLSVQIDTIRNKRTQRVEQEASEASVKILMPLMFIFGAVIVVVVGAMILRVQNNTG